MRTFSLKIMIFIGIYCLLFMPMLAVSGQQVAFHPSSIKWSRDGRKIAVNSYSGIHIFSNTLLLAAIQMPIINQYESISWSPDSRLLAGSRSNYIRIWDTESGKLVSEIISQGKIVPTVAWSPDGKLLASAIDYTHIAVWDTSSWTVLKMLIDDPGVVFLSWNPTGTRLLGQSDANLVIWDTSNWQQIHKDRMGVASEAIGWSPDGRLFVVPGGFIFDENGKPAGQVNCVQNFSPEFAAWSPDGSRIFLSSSDQAGSSLCIAEGKLYGTEIARLQGAPNAPIFYLAVSPDGKSYVTGSAALVRYETDTGRVLNRTSVAPPTPTFTASRLELTEICSPEPTKYRVWRVRNFNPIDVVFLWDVGMVADQSGRQRMVVLATEKGVPGEVTFTTKTDANSTVRIFSPKEKLQDWKVSSRTVTACAIVTPKTP